MSLGYAGADVLLTFVILALLVNGAFYAAFRSGFNLKASDPSLTAEQILAATACALFIAYHAGEARGIVLMWVLVIFMFGLLRLKTTRLLQLAGFALLGYGGVIWLLHRNLPETFDLRLEMLQWAVLGGVLVWFAFMGGYIGGLRSDLSRLNARLEERVRERTAELETLLKELETFTYAVAHDLRTPLGVMSTHAGMVLHEFGAALPGEGRHMLERIAENSVLMAQLLDDLLRFARLGHETVGRAPVDMRRLAEVSLQTLGNAKSDRNLTATVAALPGCQGDEALLGQVWINLLSNALKYTRTCEQPRIEVGYDAEQGAYYVRDNGVGFDMQYAGRLFTVFQRLHNDPVFEGAGVGLAIAARIVQRHGGRIWAEARPGAGATFYFTIP